MTMNNEFYTIISEEVAYWVEAEGDRMILRDPALDPVRQAFKIRELLDMGISALVVAPADADSLANVLTEARDRGVKVIVVDTAVLPEIFSKVLEVKKLVADKTERSYSAACKRMGISRSAFYKYRECVFSYHDKMTQQIVNFSITLRDQAGVLSNVLTTLYGMNANILTVTQNIPVDGVALVSLSLKMNGETSNPIEITHAISSLSGVVEVRLLSGE